MPVIIARQLPVAAAALVMAGSAGAQMRIASPAELAAATRDCISATGPARFDGAALAAAGWSVGKMSDGKGKAIVSPFKLYGKAGNGAVVLHGDDAKSDRLCVVMAKVQNANAFAATADALDALLAARRQTTPKEPGATYWFPSGRLVQMQPTGSTDAPSVRLSVMFMAQEKK